MKKKLATSKEIYENLKKMSPGAFDRWYKSLSDTIEGNALFSIVQTPSGYPWIYRQLGTANNHFVGECYRKGWG